MDPNLNQLRSFLLVAEEGNLTRAAQRLITAGGRCRRLMIRQVHRPDA